MRGRTSVVFLVAVGALVLAAPRARAQCNNAIAVSPPTLAVLPLGVVGTPYTASFSASGSSSGNYEWQGPTASAPVYGLYVQTTGVGGASNSIVGTPTAAGQGMFNMMLAVTDWTSPGQCLSTNFYYYFDICSNSVALNPSGGTLASGTVGVPYSVLLAGSGGSNGYYWQDLGGVPGIALAASGLATNASGNSLVGTPTTAGTFTATIELSDWPNWTSTNPVASQCTPVTHTFSITIAGPDAGTQDASMDDAGPEASPVEAGADASTMEAGAEASTMEAGPDAACMQVGGSCGTEDECCGGLECGLIEMSCCVPANGRCQQPSDCCAVSGGQAGLTCNMGICEQVDAPPGNPVAGCGSLGDSCMESTSCCGGLLCNSNACDLPPPHSNPGCACDLPPTDDSAGAGALALVGLAVTAGFGMVRRKRRGARRD
jgi:hypothetical protein